MNNHRPFGVLWDMDGVLVDTGALHFESWMNALQAVGLPFSFELFRATFGMNNRSILTQVLGAPPEPDLLERVSEQKEASFRAAVRGRARPLPGVKEWLARLKADGARQALASSAPLANIELLIDELGVRPYFGAIVSAYAMAGKPDPIVFLEAARQLGLPAERCVVVEDAVAGVEAARRAGMRCVAITNTNTREALGEADVVVDSLEELPDGAFEALLEAKK